MLRPATPLTVLFFVAFVLLLLATISTPIVKAIPLASVNGVDLGVFGYCGPKGCSKIQIGYSVDARTLFGNSNMNSDFSLPTSARSSLSAILIVHPVAAFLTLICFILSATAHLHSPSHSPRYLLALLILSIPTLLITLLAFLVDILLFVPHLAWGGWIVLASTILILSSGIVTCAMRRTLVSRKARKKRIAENADMNGQDFYARQNAAPTGLRAESPPPLASGALGQSDKLPAFATFETKRPAEEDQIPLNRRTPSNKTLPSIPSSRGPGYLEDGADRFGGPGRGGRGGMHGGRGGFGGPRDEYGNPLPPSNAFGPMPPAGMRRDRSEPPRMRPQYSDEAMGYGGPRSRGRGGYPPRGNGRGGPYGPGRGGYGRDGRGGMPMGAMVAGAGAGMIAGDMRRGPPPQGYGRPGQYDGVGPAAGYGRSPSAPTYGRRQSPGPPSAPGGYGRRQSPGPPSAPGGYNRGPPPGPPPGSYGYASQQQSLPEEPIQPYHSNSPPLPIQGGHADDGEIIGQAVEMDAVHGSPSASPAFAQPMQLRDSDSDVQGFIGLQQQQQQRDTPMSMTSVYSSQEYVPPRAAWTGTAMTRGTTPPPTDTGPVELPSQNTLRKPRSGSHPQAPSHTRNVSDNYYEDVAPRFAPPSPIQDPHQHTHQPPQTQSSTAVPSALTPGLSAPLDPHSSYEELAEGQRSPASDHSNMTSISQRGVNPNWRPNRSSDEQGRLGVPGRRAPQRQQQQQQRNDVLLGGNPDFELPRQGTRGLGGVAPVMEGQGQGQAF